MPQAATRCLCPCSMAAFSPPLKAEGMRWSMVLWALSHLHGLNDSQKALKA